MNEGELDLSQVVDVSEQKNTSVLTEGLSDDELGIDTSLLTSPRSQDVDSTTLRQGKSLEDLRRQLGDMVAQDDSKLDPELKAWIQSQLEAGKQDELNILLDIVTDVMDGEEHTETRDVVKRYSDRLLSLIPEEQRQDLNSEDIQERIMQSLGENKDKGSIAKFAFDIFKSQFPELVISSLKDPIGLLLAALGGK